MPRRLGDAPGVERRARYAPWLAEPLTQLEFVVDGIPLRERLLAVELPDDNEIVPFEDVSVVDLGWADEAAKALRRLAGIEVPDPQEDDYAPGRHPLFVCAECRDIYCGAITVAVDHTAGPDVGGQIVRWSQFRIEDAHSFPEEMPDLSALGPFVFDADAYRNTGLPLVAVSVQLSTFAIQPTPGAYLSPGS